MCWSLEAGQQAVLVTLVAAVAEHYCMRQAPTYPLAVKPSPLARVELP